MGLLFRLGFIGELHEHGLAETDAAAASLALNAGSIWIWNRAVMSMSLNPC